MIRNVLIILLIFSIFILDTPVYSYDSSKQDIKNYTLKISKKFSNTYCNTKMFGISKDGALRFAIGETKKEFSKNKLNKYIDYELLKKNIILSLGNNCNTYDLTQDKLKNIVFD